MDATFHLVNRSNLPDPVEVYVFGRDRRPSLKAYAEARLAVASALMGSVVDFSAPKERAFLGLAMGRSQRSFDAFPAKSAPWMVHVFNSEDEPLMSFPIARGESRILQPGGRGLQVVHGDPCVDADEMHVVNACPRGNLSITIQKGHFMVDTQAHLGPGMLAAFLAGDDGSMTSALLSSSLQLVDLNALEDRNLYLTGGGSGFSTLPIQFSRALPHHSHAVLEVVRTGMKSGPVDVILRSPGTHVPAGIVSALDSVRRAVPLPGEPYVLEVCTRRQRIDASAGQISVRVGSSFRQAVVEENAAGKSLTLTSADGRAIDLDGRTTQDASVLFSFVSQIENFEGSVDVTVTTPSFESKVVNIQPGWEIMIREEEGSHWFQVVHGQSLTFDLTHVAMGETRVVDEGEGVFSLLYKINRYPHYD